MKHIVELPEDVEQRLTQQAAASGLDVVDLIRAAVGRFVNETPLPSSETTWTEQLERRRRELIDKEITGTLVDKERAELAGLDRLANEHFDRIAPPPFEGAQRLHEALVRKCNDRD